MSQSFKMHDCDDLIRIFNNQFQISERTVLVAGGKEPLYLPSPHSSKCHEIIFRENFFSSALHEIAHWCIAGKKRRLLEDFGYWYKPNRNKQEQILFEQFEAKPQALEWIFSVASGIKFNISLDNFNLREINSNFKISILNEVQQYLKNGLPHRAEQFCKSLMNFYGREGLNKEEFLS